MDEGNFGAAVGEIVCPGGCDAVFTSPDDFDSHYWDDGCAGASKSHESVTFRGQGTPIPDPLNSDPLTSTFAPAKRHQAAPNRHGAGAALTNKAQGLCRKGLHRKRGPGSCLRCQADRQRNYRRKAVQ